MNPDPSNQPEPFPRKAIASDIVEWAWQTFDEKEFLAAVREDRATGGLRREDCTAELETRATSR